MCVCVQCYVAVYVSVEIKFQCLVKQRVLVVFLLVKVLLPKDENVCSGNQLCVINIAYDEIRSNRVCTTEGYAILLRSTSYLQQVLRSNLSIKIFEKRGNMSGYEVYEPSHNDYVEVVNTGEDKSDSEVTIFYRPNKGLHLVQYPNLEYHLVTEIFNTRSYTVYFWLHCYGLKLSTPI